MKILFTLFVSLHSISNFLQCQTFSVKVQYGHFFPALTQLKGDIPNCSFVMWNSDCPDVGVEYAKLSGLTFSATIGYQKDWFNFSEISEVQTFGGPLILSKTYKSIPFIFSTGYSYNLGKSRFRVNALVGIGFGLVKSDEADKYYSFDGFVTVSDNQGQYLDSQHVFINIADQPMKKILPQARISIAIEYHINHFFARTFFEARSWLSNFEEIKYHSENTSAYYQYSQTSDGHFSIRPGYLGVGLGLGWYFYHQ